MKWRHLRQWRFWCLAFPTGGGLRHQASLLMGILGDAWLLDTASGEYSFTQRAEIKPLSNSKGFPVRYREESFHSEPSSTEKNRETTQNKGISIYSQFHCIKYMLVFSFFCHLCSATAFSTVQAPNCLSPWSFTHINEFLLMGCILALQLSSIPQFPIWTMDA